MEVSVIIPTFNRACSVETAIRSALAQTCRVFEIIVVDDGSTDDSRDIIQQLNRREVNYIRHDQNRGCSAAYNTGIRAAKAELIAFLDSDDIWHPEYLEHQVRFLSRHPEVDVTFCNTEIRSQGQSASFLMSQMKVFSKLLLVKPDAPEHVFSKREMYLCMLEEIPIKPTATVVRRNALRCMELFNEGWPSGTDWDLFLRLSRVARFGYIDKALVIQHRVADATHQKYRIQDKSFLLGVLSREKAALNGDQEAGRAVNRGLCGLYNSLAWTYLESGSFEKALSLYFQGLRETAQPLMLRKIISAVGRVAARGINRAVGRSVRGGED